MGICKSMSNTSLTQDQIINILKQTEDYFCKIHKDNNINAYGFFCKIPFPDQMNLLTVLITNNTMLTENDIAQNSILKISLKNDLQIMEIIMDDSRKFYTNKDLDITIIEINPQKDKINNKYLEISNNININNFNLNNINNIYVGKEIIIIKYQEEGILTSPYAIGKIKEINSNNNIEYYLSSIEGTFFGAAILSSSDLKLIGLYTGKTDLNYNLSTFINYPIFEFNKKYNKISGAYGITSNKNEILLTIEIKDKDIGQEIYFLNNRVYTDNNQIKHCHDDLKELNESNTKLFINDKEYKYQKFFHPQEKGIYTIKLIFNTYLTDCSYMFFDCCNITNIDLSSFNSLKVIDMKNMFNKCNYLTDINFGFFNTQNVTDMNNMFSYCKNLLNLNVSSFNTQNVNDMKFMFYCCKSLVELNVSNFNTKNVNDMSFMFSGCKNLKYLDLSNFNTTNLIKMGDMFSRCPNLISVDMSSFDTKNVSEANYMFNGCNKLKEIKVSKNSYSTFKDLNSQFSVITV